MNTRDKQPELKSPRRFSSEREKLDTRGPQPKILIVDDRKENLVALRQVLQEVDADVIDATTGNQALAATLDHDFALAATAERAVEVARPLIEAQCHQLVVSLAQDRDLLLHGDPARIEQIIINLLTNAAKYTPKGGRITLSLQHDSDQHLLRVSDTGMGIPANVLPNIFDLFAQAPRSLARNEGGLGLGLTLVKALVELHGGTIHVSSVEGEGSEFVVSLPADLSPELPGSSEPPTTPDTAISKRVLLVDDNRDSAEMLGMLLTSSGHVVKLAHDGPEALAAIRGFSPDVVLLDIGLPGSNGYEVAKRIRADDALRQPLIVAVSGYDRTEDRRCSQAAGMDAHLVKPIDPTQLCDLLAK